MNNKFKGLYDTEGTSFMSDKVEPINYYEPTIKTAKIQNHTYSINFDKTELYKEIEKLQQELQKKDNNWNELKEWLEEQHRFIIEIPAFTKEISQEHKTMELCYENVLDKIEEIESGE